MDDHICICVWKVKPFGWAFVTPDMDNAIVAVMLAHYLSSDPAGPANAPGGGNAMLRPDKLHWPKVGKDLTSYIYDIITKNVSSDDFVEELKGLYG